MLFKNLVLALNFNIAANFAEEQQWRRGEWLYINVPEKLMGMRNRDVYVIGNIQSYWDVETLGQLYWEVLRRNINPIYVNSPLSEEECMIVLKNAADEAREIRLRRIKEYSDAQ